MIRNNVVMYVCDACGAEEKAKTVSWRNEEQAAMPDGWTQGKAGSQAHFCRRCSEKIRGIRLGEINGQADALTPGWC